jgi:AAA+ ATPase superfamily predicted ATPase
MSPPSFAWMKKEGKAAVNTYKKRYENSPTNASLMRLRERAWRKVAAFKQAENLNIHRMTERVKRMLKEIESYNMRRKAERNYRIVKHPNGSLSLVKR